MPCRSDYMESNEREIKVIETAKLLKWLLEQLKEPQNLDVDIVAKAPYPDKDQGDFVVALLCSYIKDFDKEKMDKYVYNGRDKMSRKLADWWEEHEKADIARLAKEKEDIKIEHEKQKALNKLTDREKNILGLK